MRIIKLGIISLIFFSLLITAFSLFIPSRVRISRAMNTGVARDSIFNQVGNIHHWRNWYPGFDSINRSLRDTGDGKTFSSADGKMTIRIEHVTDSTVIAKFSTGDKKPVIQTWQRIVHPLNDTVTIHWSMDFKLRWFPWEKFSSLMFEKRYGPLMETGLANLGRLAPK